MSYITHRQGPEESRYIIEAETGRFVARMDSEATDAEWCSLATAIEDSRDLLNLARTIATAGDLSLAQIRAMAIMAVKHREPWPPKKKLPAGCGFVDSLKTHIGRLSPVERVALWSTLRSGYTTDGRVDLTEGTTR